MKLAGNPITGTQSVIGGQQIALSASVSRGHEFCLPPTDIEIAAGIGNVACAAVLEFRHHDKSNQLGLLALTVTGAVTVR